MLNHFVSCCTHAMPKADAYVDVMPMPMPVSYSTYVIYIECSTAATEPVSFDTVYMFDRSYHSVQCSLGMWSGTVGT